MQPDLINEARRQAEICNACRYCEGYCAVFPSLHAERAFSDASIVQLANLCHNCRGCYYACQYTAPHEFALNLPRALAEVRRDSWQDYVWPRAIGKMFHENGTAVALAATLAFAGIFALARAMGSDEGGTFYDLLSHGMMVAIFLPAFLFPLLSLTIGAVRYWQATGGGRVTLGDVTGALRAAASMKNLRGGHGDGCNFEDDDRFTHARRHAHTAVMYGFLLCFGATASGTILHYGFGLHAPYGPLSLPKLLGVPGGVLMVVGCLAMLWLKGKSDPDLGDSRARSGDTAFILLLLFVAASGLALYWAGGTVALPSLLALHLGSVLAFFLLSPFTKMAHGAFRLTALLRAKR